jgi:hypothetical protein
MISGWLELMEEFELDPSLIDIVIGYPELSRRDLWISIGMVITWRLVTSHIEGLVAYHCRRMTAWGLLRLALFVKP